MHECVLKFIHKGKDRRVTRKFYLRTKMVRTIEPYDTGRKHQSRVHH